MTFTNIEHNVYRALHDNATLALRSDSVFPGYLPPGCNVSRMEADERPGISQARRAALYLSRRCTRDLIAVIAGVSRGWHR